MIDSLQNLPLCMHSPLDTEKNRINYSITSIKRALKGSNEHGLLQQVVFKCRFYKVDLRRVVVSEQWSLNTVSL